MSEQLIATSQRRYISVEEMIIQSGLSASTIRRWIKRGVLPHLQPGGTHSRVLIPADALDQLKPVPVAVPTSTAQPTVEIPPTPPQRRNSSPKWRRQFAAQLT